MAQNINPLGVPTGYEDQLASIARKRAIADALMKQGMAGGANYQSILQPLGDIFSTWAGKSEGKEADQAQAGLNTQRMADAAGVTDQVVQALQSKTPASQIAATFGMKPGYVGSSIEKIVQAQAEAEAKSRAEYNAPIEVMGTDGKRHLRTYNKAGEYTDDTSGVNLPAKLGEGPVGQLFDPFTGSRKAILPDVKEQVYLDEKGNKVVNQDLLGAKKEIAAAGKTVVNTNTYLNTMDKTFGKVIPEATVADLTKSRDAALSYKQTAPELAKASAALDKGIYAGFAGGTKLDLARMGTALGVTGKSTREKVANTQVYIQNMGRQMLPILQALKPASDTDVKTAQLMSGGDLSLDPAAMKSAIASARAAGATALKTHNSRVQNMQKSFGTNPDIANGLSTFAVPDDSEAPKGRIKVGW